MKNEERHKLRRAKKKVQEVKGFYVHLMVYVIINTMLIVVKVTGSMYYGETFMGSFWHFSTFAPPIFWGIGLGFHAVKVFSLNPILGKNWEERQIKKYMEGQKDEIEKYR